MSIADRIRIKTVTVLSDDHYLLKKTMFDWQRDDGQWATLSRDTYDRGDGCTLLPYNMAARTVLLTRQFRYPAYAVGYDDLLIETPAGLLDDASPEDRIRAEVEEEVGYRLTGVRKVFQAFMSPGAITEILHFFVAEYDASMKVSDGGGLEEEGEEVQVLERSIDEALAMVASGGICDAKTILLLQWAALNLFR
ncbi:NUDIX domain-containing protein [Caulobacter sp. DWP3-1-3b2]|uniref:NUDIX domain-containing protein n=1 Tax=Caulobacter sp. DWP3-1-3b2 TaxID=2804643 RepID=UPI003CEF8736